MSEYVDALPARVAHATHALLEARGPYASGPGPHTAAEVCLYDEPSEALSVRHTARALSQAKQHGLAAYVRGYWLPTGLAHYNERALEDRFHRDQERAS